MNLTARQILFTSLCSEKKLLLGLAALVIALNIHPYATNLLAGKHLFFWVMGEGKQVPDLLGDCFRQIPRVIQPFISAFASWTSVGGPSCESIEFDPLGGMVDPATIKTHYHKIADATQGHLLAGFGPLYKILLLLSGVGLIVTIFGKKQTSKKLNSENYLILILFATVVQVLITPPAWFARYVPLLWLAPVSIFHSLQNRGPRGVKRILSVLMVFTLSCNAIFLVTEALNTIQSYTRTNNYYKTLLKDLPVARIIHSKSVMDPITRESFGAVIPEIEAQYCLTFGSFTGQVTLWTDKDRLATVITRITGLRGEKWFAADNISIPDVMSTTVRPNLYYKVDSGWAVHDIIDSHSGTLEVLFYSVDQDLFKAVNIATDSAQILYEEGKEKLAFKIFEGSSHSCAS